MKLKSFVLATALVISHIRQLQRSVRGSGNDADVLYAGLAQEASMTAGKNKTPRSGNVS